MKHFPMFLFAAAVLAAAMLCACGSSSLPGAAKEQFFVSEVKPVLEQNCLACHNTDAHPSHLNLSESRALTARGKGGRAYIVPGHPEDSLLIAAISRKGSHPKVMPRLDLSLTDDQIGVLREWIQDGAVWPKGESGKLAPKANAER